MEVIKNSSSSYIHSEKGTHASISKNGEFFSILISNEKMGADEVVMLANMLSDFVAENSKPIKVEDFRPANCRNRLRDEGKAYPRSGCQSCGNGGLMGCPSDHPRPKDQQQIAQDEVSRLDYYAANAPEVPDWYRLKVESEDAFDSNAFFDKHSPRGHQISEAVESLYQSEIFNHKKRLQIKIYFGWRKYYAEQMVKMLGGDQ